MTCSESRVKHLETENAAMRAALERIIRLGQTPRTVLDSLFSDTAAKQTGIAFWTLARLDNPET